MHKPITYLVQSSTFLHRGRAVADRGVSGPWGPQFCGGLCNGETQRLPAGGAGSPNTFWQQYIENWLKIRYLGRCLHL